MQRLLRTAIANLYDGVVNRTHTTLPNAAGRAA
jgi:hypothetical protein